MRVLVVGPGALGCLLAAKLSRNNEVWLLDHDPARAALLDASGLYLEEAGETTRHQVRATAEVGDVGGAGLVLLCVKSRNVQEALSGARSALFGSELVLAMQNGIGHLDDFAGLGQSLCVGVGVTSLGATLVGPGHVLSRGLGPTFIGQFPRQGPADAGRRQSCRDSLLKAALSLSAAGIPTEAVDDVLPKLWDKLLVNVGINALTAINDCPNGALLDDPKTVGLMQAAVGEAALVADRLGVKIGPDPLARVNEVCLATAGNISSMLQDVRARRPTEIEAINGAVLSAARALGIAVPVNEELVRRVRSLERNYLVFC